MEDGMNIGRAKFVRVHCEKHKAPWRIAEFSTMLNGVWEEIPRATKARSIEQKKHRAEVDAMPPEEAMPSAPSESEFDQFLKRVAPGGNRPLHSTMLIDGEPTDPLTAAGRETSMMRVVRGLPAVPEPKQWQTYDLTCPECKRKRRHMTYQRQADKLFETFDELVELGRTTVTPEFLQKYETRRDSTSDR